MSIITIAREAGSLGDEIAERLSQVTGYPIIDFDKMIALFLNPIVTAQEKKALTVSSKYFFEPINDDRQINFKSYLKGSINEWAKRNDGILLGIAGHFFLHEPDRNYIHIRIVADKKTRKNRIANKQKLYEKAKDEDKRQTVFHELSFIERFTGGYSLSNMKPDMIRDRIDKQYRKFSLTLFHKVDDEFQHYHMILNTARLSLDLCVKQIVYLLEEQKKEIDFLHREQNKDIQIQAKNLPVFKNDTEEEFARLLDLYHLEWIYEPKFFPIEWDEDGQVTMAFSPDFYLPKFNIYLELTTMNQRYVSAKRKKLKKLQELYPGVHVKIIYKRDFTSLLKRFEE